MRMIELLLKLNLVMGVFFGLVEVWWWVGFSGWGR